MTIRQTTSHIHNSASVAGTVISLLALAIIFFYFGLALAADEKRSENPVKGEIWKLEEAYFTNLYRANYEGVLALVHPQFLGWPGNLPKPINKEESARFMKELIPRPTPCNVRIERTGLRQSGDAALTHYVLHVSCVEASGTTNTTSSRITHTWTRHKGQWKLLGGMSVDIK